VKGGWWGEGYRGGGGELEASEEHKSRVGKGVRQGGSDEGKVERAEGNYDPPLNCTELI